MGQIPKGGIIISRARGPGFRRAPGVPLSRGHRGTKQTKETKEAPGRGPLIVSFVSFVRAPTDGREASTQRTQPHRRSVASDGSVGNGPRGLAPVPSTLLGEVTKASTAGALRLPSIVARRERRPIGVRAPGGSGPESGSPPPGSRASRRSGLRKHHVAGAR